MARRVFRDAPAFCRCEATIVLRDKSMAQCGRYQNEGASKRYDAGAGFCTQHFGMWVDGKMQYTTGPDGIGRWLRGKE